MAASTPIAFSLTSKDWETIVGIISNASDASLREMVYQLTIYYRAQQIAPAAADVIVVNTTEAVVASLASYLYGNTVYNVYKDTGASPMNRIMSAIRAANNVADNYISLQLAKLDTSNDLSLTGIRKIGRAVIMMSRYDNQ